MRHRTIIRGKKLSIKNITPVYIWASLGLTLVSIGIIVGIMALLPPQPSQAASVANQTTRVIKTNRDLLQDYWGYLPGATRVKNAGLLIRPDSFAIVNQNGTPGQVNPPVNLYGTRLQVGGDFEVQATLKQVRSKATFSLYGQVPVVYDEFRYERNSLKLIFSGKQLLVQTWQNESQQPKTVATYTIDTTANTEQLSILRHDGLLAFTVNGHKLGSISENGLFSDGSVWFGASAENQSWSLAALRAIKKNNAPLDVVTTTSLTVPTDPTTLQQLLNKKNSRPGFTIGAAMALAPITSDPDYARTALGGNFGSVTTENALKWQFVHPTPTTYDFQEADALVDIARRHHMAVHGHTLVFGEANPQWVQSLPTTTAADKKHVQDVMLNHISAVVGHYKGKIASWDVVNEPLADYPEFEAGNLLRDHVWYRALGDSYITSAFKAARIADPNAKLYINEFGLEDDGERWDYFLQLVTRLKSQGAEIDGVGIQTHVYEASDKVNPAILKRHMQQLAAIGLKSRISEMDVYSEDGQAVQAQQFSTVLKTCLDQPSCVSFTTWGVSDRYDMFRDDDGSLQYGEDFLWDHNMKPTPAVSAIQQILK